MKCASSAFTIETGGGAFDLGPGVSRTVTVAYAPYAAGVDFCQLAIATGCADVACTGTAPDPNDHWWSGFSSNAPNSTVAALTLHGSQLAVGGSFTQVGDVPTANVAWWNGSVWTPSTTTPGLDNVDVLHEWQGSLIAGGYYNPSEGYATRQRLSNGTWQTLGGSFDGPVMALATWQNELYVGGENWYQGYRFLDRWNGAAWVAADSGLSGSVVNDLEVIGGAFYAATGVMYYRGNASASAVAQPQGGGIFQRVGGSWTLVTDTFNGAEIQEVEKLTTHAGALYAIVYTVNQDSYIARLAGSTLVQVGHADGYVADLASFGDQLYVTGSFGAIDGVAANRVAAWNGSSWHALGSGIEGSEPNTNAIIPFGAWIYVGGNFRTAGGRDSPNIARWIP